MKLIVFILAITGSLVSTAHAQVVPGEHTAPSCAANPAELQAKPETLARVNTMGGLQGILGVWQLSNIFAHNRLSFDYDSQHFYVQNGNENRKVVSLCADANDPNWIRISIHHSGCIENKNIKVQADGPSRMHLTTYATKILGIATFKKVSNKPAAPGVAKGQVKCKDGSLSVVYPDLN